MLSRLTFSATSSAVLRRRLRLKPLSSLATSSPSPSHLPLFLRPLSHSAPLSSLLSFRRWAESLSLSLSSVDLDSSHLLRELSWLLEDATSAQGDDTVLLRTELDDLYHLWRERVEKRRPFQYLVGCEHWRDLVLAVREGVLIPRPETEMLVDLAREAEGFGIGDEVWVDLGTGSGAIAIAIGRLLLGERARVLAIDVSSVSVEITRFNVQRYGLQDKVEIRQGSWFEPLQDMKGNINGIVSNPPYIPAGDLSGLQPEVGWHEPRLALDGGNDGTAPLLHIIEGSASALKSGGFFAFETNGDKQSELVADLMSTKWGDIFQNIKILPDYAGIKRFITGYKR